MERETSGRPSSMRPPSAISVPRTAALMSAASRPLTRQGLTGLKPTTAGGQRIYKDKRYYMAMIQNKNTAIRDEVGRLRKVTEENRLKTLNLEDMRKKAKDAAKKIEEQQELLAAYNITLEMHISKTKEQEVMSEIDRVKRDNEFKMKELDNLFSDKMRLQDQFDKLQRSRDARDKTMKAMIENLPNAQREEYFSLERELQAVQKDIREIQDDINKDKENIEKYKAMIQQSPNKMRTFAIVFAVLATLHGSFAVPSSTRGDDVGFGAILDCIVGVLNDGVPEFGVPSLNPLDIDRYFFDLSAWGVPGITGGLTVTDLLFTGLLDLDIQSIESSEDGDDFEISATIAWPTTALSTNHDGDFDIFGLVALWGSGRLDYTLNNLSIDFGIKGSLGESGLVLTEVIFRPTIGGFSDELQEKFQLLQTIQRLETQKAELTAFLSNTQTPAEQREALLQQIKQDKADIDALQKLSGTLEQETNEIEAKIAEIDKELESKDSTRLKKHKELREREAHMDAFIASYPEKSSAALKKIEFTNKQIHRILDLMSDNLAELNLDEFGKVHVDVSDQSLESWNKKCAALAAQKEKLKAYKVRFDAEIARLLARKNEMLNDIENMSNIEKRKEELIKEKSILEDEKHALYAKLESTQSAVSEANRRKHDLTKKLEDNPTYHKVVQIEKSIEELESKKREIETLLEADKRNTTLDDITATVQALLRQRNDELISRLRNKK